jgi:junctophilin
MIRDVDMVYQKEVMGLSKQNSTHFKRINKQEFIFFLHRYEGEWFANKKYGYGVTTFRDGTKEEGKYKNNVLITSQKKKHLFLIRSAKFRERIDAAVDSAQRASKYALQKADIAISRTATARGKAELADLAAGHARADSDIAIQTAREFAPDFKPNLLERFERIRVRERFRAIPDDTAKSIPSPKSNVEQLSSNQTQVANNLSPNKPNTSIQQQQHLLSPQGSNRRPSMNQPPKQQQAMDYSNINSNNYVSSSSSDYGNPMAINQQFGQPQPPGNYGSPQKYPSQSQTGYSYQNPSTSMQQSSNIQNNQNQMQYQQQQQQQQQQLQYQQAHQKPMNLDLYQSNYHQQNQSSMQMNNNYSDHLDGNRMPQNMVNYGDTQSINQSNIRRNSKLVSDSGRPMLGAIDKSSSIDHFDHYKRPPSRDSSVDRYTRAASRLGGSRQASVDRQPIGNINTSLASEGSMDRNVRAGSQFRGTTPVPSNISNMNVNGSVMTGTGSAGPNSRRGSRSGTPVFQMPSQPLAAQIQAQYSSPNQPFEDVLLRQRTLGQDIIPSPGQPKRTESLFVPNKPSPKNIPMNLYGIGGGGSSSGSGGGAGRRVLKVSFCFIIKSNIIFKSN